MNKKVMLQLFRMLVTLVLMVIMACSIFSLRSQLAESKQKSAALEADLKVAQSQIGLQQVQIEVLTKRIQETESVCAPAPLAPAAAFETD